MPAREPLAPRATPFETSGWGPWSDEPVVESGEGPGLLVSRMFWLGGGMSLALWGCVTLLALQCL